MWRELTLVENFKCCWYIFLNSSLRCTAYIQLGTAIIEQSSSSSVIYGFQFRNLFAYLFSKCFQYSYMIHYDSWGLFLPYTYNYKTSLEFEILFGCYSSWNINRCDNQYWKTEVNGKIYHSYNIVITSSMQLNEKLIYEFNQTAILYFNI